MCVDCKNKLFLRHFNKQLKSNKVKKIYEAILVGVLDKDIKIKSKIDTSTKQHRHKVTESIDGKKLSVNV